MMRCTITRRLPPQLRQTNDASMGSFDMAARWIGRAGSGEFRIKQL
jgi:hypothetical protein